MKRKHRAKTSKLAWGVFWLLIAGLIMANYFGGFVQLTVWNVVIGALALIVLFHCLATLSVATLPIPVAALYYIFQAPLGLPFVAFWTLVLVTLLVTCGLHVLLPGKLGSRKHFAVVFDDDKNRGRHSGSEGDRTKTQIDEGDDDNNPYISVQFGGVSRYLHSDNLETADLNCAFGGLEVFFDHVKLSPNGAEVYVNCKFGAIEIYVPSHWRIIDDVTTSLGSAEVDRRIKPSGPDAPTLRLHGNVAFGSVEVCRIKGT